MYKRLFDRYDFLCAGIAGGLSLMVYVFTMAPNVTLLDSGEFLIAAQHFGVAHPTGYPLWTLLAWLFQLLPFGGNVAWKVALFSGICAALAVALCALLISNVIRWLFGEERRGIAFLCSLTWSLLYAFSQSQWSQAVIVEVYALHALLVGLFLLALYAYIRKPESIFRLLLTFFFLALSFSNHHLTLVLVPLPFLAVLLLQRQWIWDLCIFSLITGILFYLLFALASEDPVTLITALRFFYIGLVALIIFVWVRRFRAKWAIFAFLPFVVFLGLLPYAYMPLASSTNPPMNWGYTRTTEGFFYSFNRTQYAGSLSGLLLRSIGKITGTAPRADDQKNQGTEDDAYRSHASDSPSQQWIGFFWFQLARNFTPFCVIAFFAAFFGILKCDLPRRTTIYLLLFAFVLSAFLQPILEDAEIDVAGWWLQMPYHTHTYFIFALICAVGTAALLVVFQNRFPRAIPFAGLLLLLPVLTAFRNEPVCSQRDHWFGWEFGHEILKDLPQGAILYGGTDPGRFVPTYMIFGESPQSPKVKPDPAFDRQDIYIITQNALADKFYRRYIHDHYAKDRPPVKNAFERWLGRETAYPREPLVLPDQTTVKRLLEENEDKALKDVDHVSKSEKIGLPHAIVAEWIFKQNRDKHAFFLEESFPMRWSYDYAVPYGLIFKLHREKLDAISAEDVERDMRFWKGYSEKLQSNPHFKDDFDAQRTFSKLRTSQGNLYRHHKMNKEAKIAYHQALELWPSNGEAIVALAWIFWDEGEYQEPIPVFERGLHGDPNNRELLRLTALAVARRDVQKEIRDLEYALDKNPHDEESLHRLIRYNTSVEDTNAIRATAKKLQASPAAEDAQMMGILAAYFLEAKDLERAATYSDLALHTTNPPSDLYLLDTKISIAREQFDRAVKSALKAVEQGGVPARERLEMDPAYKLIQDRPEIKEAIGGMLRSRSD